MRIKIIGAGSAGIHHAHAARVLGWEVDVFDTDMKALERMPTVYAERYGFWDDAIDRVDLNCRWEHDVVVIATPPETHVELALNEWRLHSPKAMLIEKPLCAPGQVEEAKMLLGKPVFVGYAHTLDAERRKFDKLYVRWTEHWEYILKAHPWMRGPHDSYLGDWHQGGGALSEHSHGLNMWQHLAREAGHGEAVSVMASVEYANGYDRKAFLSLRTEDGFIGHVLQDVQSQPAIKWASTGQSFNGCPFKAELEHVATADPETSPIGIAKGLHTVEVIAAAHRSAKEERRVQLADLRP